MPSEASSEPADEPGIRQAANTRGFSVGLVQLDGFHVTEIFERRAHVMRVVPHFMRAAFSSAMKAACEGILSGFSAGDLIHQERAWKFLFLLPRMLLCRPRRGGHVPKKELQQRLAMFNSGNWQELVSHSVLMSEQASQNLVRRGRLHKTDTLEARALRAERFVQLGEISAGRQALESARVAPGTLATLRALTSPERRFPVPREPIPPHLASAVPESPFDLDFDRLVSNIRSAKRGAAPGPSGLTTEHLHPILENDSSVTALFRVGVLFSRGHVPPGALEALRLGRITALAKPDGIVVGDVLRRVVAKTIAQQIGDQVEKSTAPFQFALKTRAGSECVAHTLRTLSELNEATTILSVDGVGAFDLISRSAMMQGLVDMPDGVKVLPFVRMFYGTPSQFLWEDELGTVSHIPQGEGGEQGDPLMPLLFSLGQHRALTSVAAELHRGEQLFAFHDDLFVTAQPDHVVDIYHSLATHLWNQARITLHQGKTVIWNKAGICPRGCHELEDAARRADPNAVVWRGNVLLEPQLQGLVVLGVPVGRPEFILAKLEAKSRQHNVLLDWITSVGGLQSA